MKYKRKSVDGNTVEVEVSLYVYFFSMDKIIVLGKILVKQIFSIRINDLLMVEISKSYPLKYLNLQSIVSFVTVHDILSS